MHVGYPLMDFNSWEKDHTQEPSTVETLIEQEKFKPKRDRNHWKTIENSVFNTIDGYSELVYAREMQRAT